MRLARVFSLPVRAHADALLSAEQRLDAARAHLLAANRFSLLLARRETDAADVALAALAEAIGVPARGTYEAGIVALALCLWKQVDELDERIAASLREGRLSLPEVGGGPAGVND